MVGIDNTKEFPVFIPPRKRQSSKKSGANPHYVDHIVSIQGRSTKLSPTSPCSLLEDSSATALMKTSLISNASIQQLEKRLSADELTAVSSHRDLNSTKGLNEQEQAATNSNELNEYENISTQQLNKNFNSSSNITPSSYSESSLDVKSTTQSHDCLTRPSTTKKRVNIKADFLFEKNFKNSSTFTNYEDLESGDTSILNAELDHSSSSLDRRCRYTPDGTISTIDSSYLTMTGTVKRGRKKGQSVDLQINISREELEKINTAALVAAVEHSSPKNLCCLCTASAGMHILILSLLCLPFVTVVTSVYSFYIGTLTWYNMFNYFNEEKSYLHKLIMSPLLILTYPIIIVLCTLGLGIYAGCVQVSVRFNNWINEIGDIEKGFYGWLCSFLHLSDCSPYEVVILMDLKLPPASASDAVAANSSTEELSL